MTRKLLRDLVGLTGLKAAATLAFLYAHPDPSKVQFGYAYRKKSTTEATNQPTNGVSVLNFLKNSRRIFLAHGTLTGLCAVARVVAHHLYGVCPLVGATHRCAQLCEFSH